MGSSLQGYRLGLGLHLGWDRGAGSRNWGWGFFHVKMLWYYSMLSCYLFKTAQNSAFLALTITISVGILPQPLHCTALHCSTIIYNSSLQHCCSCNQSTYINLICNLILGPERVYRIPEFLEFILSTANPGLDAYPWSHTPGRSPLSYSPRSVSTVQLAINRTLQNSATSWDIQRRE